jgi:RNA polymerase sigma factor (sigma-70 family)
MATAQIGTLLGHIRTLAAGPAEQGTDRQLLEDFAARHDEAAFAALVSRHGAMVLRVCRRVLGHEQDAEDAFQATFLVLARCTASIRRRDTVGGWLYGVAYRTALKARRSAARRRNHETHRPAVARPAPDRPSWDEVQAALDEEVGRLPGPMRQAFVLCVLDGKSGAEAAAELGCKEGTVKSRVSRARQLLQRQLARRGIELAALLAALAVAESAGRTAPPAVLVRTTVRFGILAAAGSPAAGVIPSHVAALAAGVTRAMTPSKLPLLTAALLAVGLVAGAAAFMQRGTAADETEKPAAAASARPSAAEAKDDSVEVSGRVVDPDGKPFAGATVFFTHYILSGRGSRPPAVTSDAAGRFRLRVSRTGYPEEYMKAHWMRGAVVAVGRGFGFGWAGTDDAAKLTDVTVRLTREVPITGRVIDLQGKPIGGVTVQVRGVRCRQDGGDLKAFVEALQAKKQSRPPYWPALGLSPSFLGLPRPAVTGADGRFRLTGLPGECLVSVRFSGPTIEAAEVNALTRPAPTIVTPRSESRADLGTVVFHGNTFDHAAAPTRPVVGIVRDRDTGNPLAGVTIRSRLGSAREHFSSDPYLETTTDAEGHYRLVGLTREGKHLLEALPAAGQPYLSVGKTPAAPPGLGPVTVDFALKRGVWIRGRVTDKATGRPVPALVEYGAFADNPFLKEAAGYRDGDSDRAQVRTAADGSFTLLGLPGPGLVAAKATDPEDEGRYLTGLGADAIHGPRNRDSFDTEPYGRDPFEFHALAAVCPAREATAVVCDLVLDPGRTVTGTLVDPDGKPVSGAGIEVVRGSGFRVKELPTAAFRVTGIDPQHPRWYFVRHPGRHLGAVVLLKGDEPAPVTVRLQKCATVTGRVVDADGLPRPAWITGVVHRGQLGTQIGIGLGMERAGKDGRFRLEGVIPGLKIELLAGKNTTYFDTLIPELTLKPGEVKDVGDVTARPSP